MAVISLPKSLNDVVVNDFSAVPPATYELEIVKVKHQVSQAGNPMLVVQYKIINDDEYTGKMVFENVSLVPEALFTLKAISMATGLEIDSDFDTDDLIGEVVTAVLDVETYNGKDKNVIKRYEFKE